MAARPNFAMPTAMMASLTCKREDSESDSVSEAGEQTVHSTRQIQLRESDMPLNFPDKLRSQQILAGKWGEKGRMGKQLVDGASCQQSTQAWRGKLLWPCEFLKQTEPQRVAAERTRETKPDGWNPGWPTGSSGNKCVKLKRNCYWILNKSWPLSYKSLTYLHPCWIPRAQSSQPLTLHALKYMTQLWKE